MTSVWFPDQGDGIPDATAEELTAEPLDQKAMRLLGTLKAYVAQDEHLLCAIIIDGSPLVIMPEWFWKVFVAS